MIYISGIKTDRISPKTPLEVAGVIANIKRGNGWKEGDKDKVQTIELPGISVGFNLCPEAERHRHQPEGGRGYRHAAQVGSAIIRFLKACAGLKDVK